MSPLPSLRELIKLRNITESEDIVPVEAEQHFGESDAVVATGPDEPSLTRRCLNAGATAVRITLANDWRNVARDLKHF